MGDTYRRHQPQQTLITGAGPTAIAAAKAGWRVVLYAYALVGATTTFTNSDATALTGVIPAGFAGATQPEYLLKSANDLGMSVTGGATGYCVWAYEKVMVVAQNF